MSAGLPRLFQLSLKTIHQNPSPMPAQLVAVGMLRQRGCELFPMCSTRHVGRAEVNSRRLLGAWPPQQGERFGCVCGVAEGGTGRRPHARPGAALPTAKPAALTQYRKSSPIAGSRRVQAGSRRCPPTVDARHSSARPPGRCHRHDGAHDPSRGPTSLRRHSRTAGRLRTF